MIQCIDALIHAPDRKDMVASSVATTPVTLPATHSCSSPVGHVGSAVYPAAWAISEPYAGLQAQIKGIAEAVGLAPEIRSLKARGVWKNLSPSLWPMPLRAIEPEALAGAIPEIIIGGGGMAARIGAALKSRHKTGIRVVQVQHPRMNPARFDVVLVAEHDGLTGPNVLVTRNALHGVTPQRLAEAAALWAPRFAHLPRPLVAVLVGGSNGRYRLDRDVAVALGADLAAMMQADHVGIALTPSRRTAPDAVSALRQALEPRGGWVWNGEGDNPYFGLLACADAIVTTEDSVSMVSEAVATSVPVLLARLPGRSRRIGQFNDRMMACGRVRPFRGRLEQWATEPLDDTPAVAAELRHRLNI
ncbi:Hypothetical protein GbCGDNIH7_0634 [Granulibacter bethesdensis]|nr:Hypothetical protein GbCGDNIH7_0634 [Granulibacter bethesdensis]